MRHYDIDVSIITDKISPNLQSIIDYAVERGITYEIVERGKDPKGKITFHYDPSYYYYPNYIHHSFLKLTCPMGYDPGDIDLPERLVYSRKNIIDLGSNYYQCKANVCDVVLTHTNGYGNYILEEEVVGHCCIGNEEDIVKSVLEKDPDDLFIKRHFCLGKIIE